MSSTKTLTWINFIAESCDSWTQCMVIFYFKQKIRAFLHKRTIVNDSSYFLSVYHSNSFLACYYVGQIFRTIMRKERIWNLFIFFFKKSRISYVIMYGLCSLNRILVIKSMVLCVVPVTNICVAKQANIY